MIILLLFCKMQYVLVALVSLGVYWRTRSVRDTALTVSVLACGMLLTSALGLSMFEGLICRPWIWLIMG